MSSSRKRKCNFPYKTTNVKTGINCKVCGQIFKDKKGLNMHFININNYRTHLVDEDCPNRVVCNTPPCRNISFHADLSEEHHRNIHMVRGLSEEASNESNSDTDDGAASVCFDFSDKEVLLDEEHRLPPVPFEKHEAELVNIFTSPHVVMSNKTCERIIKWANRYASKIVSSKVRTYDELKKRGIGYKSNLEQFQLVRSRAIQTSVSYNVKPLILPAKDETGSTVNLEFRFRDLSTVILELLSKKSLQRFGFQFSFQQMKNLNGKRIFGELWTGDDWRDKEKRLIQKCGPLSKMIYCILYMDATTKRGGSAHAQTYTPLLLSLGNTPMEGRTVDSAKSLLGFIPCMKHITSSESLRVTHEYFKYIVNMFKSSLEKGGLLVNVPDTDKSLQKIVVYPVLGLLLGDRPMRCHYAGLSSAWNYKHPCPCCTGLHSEQNDVSLERMVKLRSMKIGHSESADSEEENEVFDAESEEKNSDSEEEGDGDSDKSDCSVDKFGGIHEGIFEEIVEKDTTTCGNSSEDEQELKLQLRTVVFSQEKYREATNRKDMNGNPPTYSNVYKELKSSAGIMPVENAFWESPLQSEYGVYSSVPADMLHDIDLGTMKDAIKDYMMF